MLKLKNVVIAVLVLAAGIYGGLRAYVYFKFKDRVDRSVAMARPFAKIEYTDLSTSLDGVLSIEGLRVEPAPIDDRIEIERLDIHTPGFGFLVSGAGALERGELPERLALKLEGLRLDLHGDLFDVLERAQMQADPSPAIGVPAGCRLGGSLRARDYRALGYDTVIVDGRLAYDFGGGKPGVQVDFDVAARHMQSFSINARLVGPIPHVGAMTSPETLLTDMEMVFSVEPAFGSRVVRYCANALGVATEEYVQQLVEQTDAQYMERLGFVPGPGIRAALERFLSAPGEVRISAQPAVAVDPKTLSRYPLEQAVGILGLQVSVNGEPVEDLSVAVKEGNVRTGEVLSRIPGVGRLAAADGREREETGSSEPETQRVLKYRPVPKVELKRYVGRQVRLQTAGGKARKGILVDVKGTKLSLERRVYGGTFTMPVALDEIEKAEVWMYAPRDREDGTG